MSKGGQGKAFTVLWLECWPAHRAVMGSIHRQGNISGLRVFSLPPVRVHMGSNQSISFSHIDVSLSLCPLPLFLQSKGKNILM